MVYKPSCHQDASPNINGKGIVNHPRSNLFDGIQTVHIAISRIIDQNINPSVAFKHFGINILDGILTGDITFDDEIVGIYGLKLMLYNACIPCIRLKISVSSIPVCLCRIERSWYFLIH